MKIAEYIFQFLIFPGFLFSSAMGLIVGWVDRKVTARVQWRAGPPWYQNFADVLKLLLYKETLIPQGVSKFTFLGMPVLAMSAATLVSTVILVINAAPRSGFIGDVIVIAYLLLIPAVALIIGAFSFGNPLASLGASREMKLMLSYELPFILALIVPVIKCGYVIRLGGMIMHQSAGSYVIASASGVLSFIAMLLCMQAKLGFVPFDMPEAETEIMAGACIEYSGKTLAIFKLTKAIMLFIVPIFMITLYFGGIKSDAGGFIKNILQYLLIIVLIVVIKNTNPRVRIDQAMRFFWGPVTVIAALSAALAFLGY
jgi:NADH-quinone oxidoreductase subunit H